MISRQLVLMRRLGQDEDRGPLKRGAPEEFTDNPDRAKAKHQKSSSGATSPATPTPSTPSVATSPATPTPSTPPVATSSATPIPSTPSVRTAREIYERIVRTKYPGYKPKNDFELYTLGSSDLSWVPDGALEAHLMQEWFSLVVDLGGSADVAMAKVRSYLDVPAEVTGVSRYILLSQFVP